MPKKSNSTKSLRRRTNPEKKLLANATGNKPKGKSNSKNDGKKVVKKSDQEMKKRAIIFHRLKREVLAPFLVRLLLRNRWEEVCDNLLDEFTMYEPQTTIGDTRRSSGFSLYMIQERNDEKDDESDTSQSHHDDWRDDKENDDPSDESDGDVVSH